MRGLPGDVDRLVTVSVLTEVAAATGASAATEEALALLTAYAGRGVLNGGGVA